LIKFWRTRDWAGGDLGKIGNISGIIDETGMGNFLLIAVNEMGDNSKDIKRNSDGRKNL
jgi:hypothetical protein